MRKYIRNLLVFIKNKEKKSEEDKEESTPSKVYLNEEFQGVGFFLKEEYFEKKEKSLLFVHNTVINRRLLKDMNIEIIVFYYDKGKFTPLNLNHRKEVYDFDLLPELFAVEIFKEDKADNNVFLIKNQDKSYQKEKEVFVFVPSKKKSFKSCLAEI